MPGIIGLLNSSPLHLHDHECFMSKELDTAQPLCDPRGIHLGDVQARCELVFEYLIRFGLHPGRLIQYQYQS
jgi:hypothetical protein